MDIIGRYIFRQTATALATILITLTLIVWMTTALRELSLVTNQGQSVLVFLTITLLAMPNLIAIVAPVALLIATLHTLNRLSGDSELIVLSASGSTIWRVARPFLILATILFVCLMAVNAYILPQSMRTLRDYAVKVRTDLISQVIQPGKFSSPEKGLTIHISGKDANGDLLGLMIHDERDQSQIMTYLAERSQIQKVSEDKALLVMRNGHVQRQDGDDRDASIVTFESYIFDLSQFGPKEGPRDYKPRERFLSELMFPDPADEFHQRNSGRFFAELHDRLASPLYPFLFVLIALVHLGAPRTTRDSRMKDLFTAFAVATVLRVLSLAATNMAAKTPAAVLIIWGIPVIGIAVTALMAHYEIKPMTLPSFSLKALLPRRAPRRGPGLAESWIAMAAGTLGWYFAKRIFAMILVVFGLCLLLVFLIDFVEMMREAAKADVPAGTVVGVTLMRLPAFAGLALPFSVLIGTISAFLMLSRSSELVIVRAAGISVWQFIRPAMVVALLVGLFAVMVYNPLAASSKQAAERMFAELFTAKKSRASSANTSSWIRQDGPDGPSIIYARASADRGTRLAGLTLLQFDPNKKFMERIEADKAILRSGYWELENAHVSSSGSLPQFYRKYQVSTFLEADQVRESVNAVDGVSFWELPGFIEFAQKAGLSTTAYELHYQQLMARPFLMICMVLLAATCSLKPFRFGKIQTMVIAGLSAGFAFFVLVELSRKLGMSGYISAGVAAWAPIAIASLLALTVLLHQEDG